MCGYGYLVGETVYGGRTRREKLPALSRARECTAYLMYCSAVEFGCEVK